VERSEVFRAISSERDYQDRRWGTVEEHPHEVGAWIALLQKRVNDALVAWASSSGDVKALDEIRKVAALAVACGEQYGFTDVPRVAIRMAGSKRQEAEGK
jgi:hypothetical protein